MRTHHRIIRGLAVLGAAAVTAGLTVPPAAAGDTVGTFTLTGGGLSISAPAGPVHLGTVSTGAPAVTGTLGTVTVQDTRGALVAAWTATVSSSDFVTGTATAAETVGKAAVTYTPGPTTASSAGGVFVPGAGALGATLPVYTGAAVGNNFASWNPTVSVALPAKAVAGTYTGTITHSVS